MIKKASLKKRSAGIKKTLVLGVGNTIRGDDAVGILAVRALDKVLSAPLKKQVELRELEDSGINLLELLSGYKKAIVVDSITTKNAKAGTIYEINREALCYKKPDYSTHQFGIPAILDMAEQLCLDIPINLKLFAVEIASNDDFSTKVSPIILDTVPRLVKVLKKELITNQRR
jgi:hydrogenase maturation protease